MSDYDADSRSDFALWRPSTGSFHVLTSSSNWTTGFDRLWGIANDVPVATDYTGDGRDEIAVYRPSDGTWHWLTSESNWTSDVTRPSPFAGVGVWDYY
jgi:hypothetical protein